MIHHLRGEIAEKSPGSVVLELGGVGLQVYVTDATWAGLGTPGQEARLLTHLVVRDDGWTLYGFPSDEERAVFRLLLGVQGIGPRLALAVLSALPLPRLRHAVGSGDVSALTQVTGIGKKTAQRMIVDLKDKLGEFLGGDEESVLSAAADSVERDDAVDALVALGYPRPAAIAAVRGARTAPESAELPIEKILREALRRI